MLHQGIRKPLYLLVSFFALSCNDDNQTNALLNVSLSIVDGKDYRKIYNQANDSLKNWTYNRLETYSNQSINEWQLDSLVCFNRTGDKCMLAILSRTTFFKSSNSDGLDYFYGVKIGNKWYFFKGPSIVLPRELYQDNTDTPLSFKKLHEIAMKEIYAGYLKPKGFMGLGGYEINDNFFHDLTSIAWYAGAAPTTQAQWDAIYLKIIRENWLKRDTLIYKPE